MLAAADWVIYAIPVIAFLVYLLSTALRPQQPPPPVARPPRRTDTEPVVFPSPQSPQPQEIPVVQPVSNPPASRQRLEEFLERRRKQRRPEPNQRGRSPTTRRIPPPVVQIPEPAPPEPRPTAPVVEPVVVLPPSAIIAEPPRPAPATPTLPRPATAMEESQIVPTQVTRRAPPPALVFLSRYLQRREDLQAIFLLREILAPPKSVQVLWRRR